MVNIKLYAKPEILPKRHWENNAEKNSVRKILAEQRREMVLIKSTIKI
jgi:hypothetical protein